MVGPDNNLWFTDLFDRIGRFDLATKTATMFTGMTPGSVPHFLMIGPDGHLWFAQQFEERVPEPGGQNRTRTGESKLGRFDVVTHEFTEYGGLPPGVRLHGLTTDADGHIWGTLESTSQIIRFNMRTQEWDKTVQFSAGSGPHDAILGPDGNIYVVLTDNGKIGQYNPQTEEVREFATSLTPQDGNSLVFLTVGPDPKFLWFSEFLNDRIGRLNIITGEVTEFTTGISPNSAPIGIVVGPDNNIWFTEPVLDTRVPGRMGRLVISDADKFTNPIRRYVGRLYRDFLGREVDPGGLNYFGGLLEQGRANRFQVAQSLLTSREARIQIVLRVYLSFLGRGPNPQELEQGLGFLDLPGGLGQLEATVVSSQEYYRLRGLGTDEGFLAALYHDLLGRSPTPGDSFEFTSSVSRIGSAFDYTRDSDARNSARLATGVPGQLGLKATPEQLPRTFEEAVGRVLGGSRATFGETTVEGLRQQLAIGIPRAAVAGQLLGSKERIERLVRGLHGRFLFAPAPPPTVDLLTNALRRGMSGDPAIATIASSPEYRGLGEKPR
jgi:streptogramin lyase